MTTLPPEDNSAQGAAQPEQPAQPVPPQQPTPQQQPAAPQYEAPPAAGYQQPQYAQQPAPVAANPVSNLQLNYWLSVFFTWLPALIFWLIEKDKGDQRATKLHVDNFNFSLLRTIAYLAIIVIGWIPYIGWIIAILLWLAQIVLFVFHIIAATKVKTSYETDGKDPFIFNIPMVK